MKQTLLPSGLYDLLPPEARQEQDVVGALLSTFASFGYEQVCPPLLEFENTLFAGRGETLSAQTFRVMDPLTQHMMGFRADMTLQVARIAATRMAAEPRPLRLCYAGPALRVKAEALRAERQMTQAGIELIGATSPRADAEVILVAIESLKKLGIQGISIDLNLPGLVPMLLEQSALSEKDRPDVERALTHKDIVAIQSIAFTHRDTLIALLQSAGPTATAMPKLRTLDLPGPMKNYLTTLEMVVKLLETSVTDVSFTVDATEYRGLEYHTGVSFSLFGKDVRGELGRGGRYQLDGDTESEATGFTLYVGNLLPVLKPLPLPARVFLPVGTAEAEARKLRNSGYTTVYGLEESAGNKEAQRLRCTHTYQNGKVNEL